MSWEMAKQVREHDVHPGSMDVAQYLRLGRATS